MICMKVSIHLKNKGWLLLCKFFVIDPKVMVCYAISPHLFLLSSSALQHPTAYRPRLLLAGAPGSGQSSHLAPALMHHLDKLPVHRLDLPTLYSVSTKTPEESCAQVTSSHPLTMTRERSYYLFSFICNLV